jgi:hypothetical protein
MQTAATSKAENAFILIIKSDIKYIYEVKSKQKLRKTLFTSLL